MVAIKSMTISIEIIVYSPSLRNIFGIYIYSFTSRVSIFAKLILISNFRK